MAEEKHRMLFQGQDPSQPVLSQRSFIPRSCSERMIDDTAATTATTTATTTITTTAPQVTPRCLTNRSQDFQLHKDHRRTFFAEPQHLRNQLEQSDVELTVDAIHEVASNPSDQIVEVQTVPQNAILSEVASVPRVRSFFALAAQPKLGAKSCSIVCPACGHQGRTRLRCSPNTRTHLCALWLCSFGWCCCACLYPYLMNSCRTNSHYCTTCRTFLGAYYPKDCCH